jgi:hypothetical protein
MTRTVHDQSKTACSPQAAKGAEGTDSEIRLEYTTAPSRCQATTEMQ